MPRAYTPSHIAVPLPAGHRFPMLKYRLLAEHLQRRGWRIEAAPEAPWKRLARVHREAYLKSWREGTLTPRAERLLGLPYSPELLARSLASVGGTLLAVDDACRSGLGINLAGGTHHAFADRGEGFCVFNDLAVAAHYALERYVKRVLIVDLDVHQGNGTASIFAADPRVFTFSVHGARNYPFRKEASDLDLPLADGVGDLDYLAVLGNHLPAVMTKHRPDLVLYQAGVDVLAGDRFGRLALSHDGIVARDAFVAELCRQAGIPLVYTMGGGYHPDISQTVAAHAGGLEALAATLGADREGRP